MANEASQYLRDQLKFAREGAQNLAKRGGYTWTEWLKNGRCTAAFEREGARWSLSFKWTPSQPLEHLAEQIEKMDFNMRVAQRQFGMVKLGHAVRTLGQAQGEA